jgi:hypothetical protein
MRYITSGRFQVLDTPEDIQWLRETHGDIRMSPEVQSAILYGNEDCPDLVELFASPFPSVTDSPVGFLVPNDQEEEEQHAALVEFVKEEQRKGKASSTDANGEG